MDLVLSFVERYLIQCPFLGGSSLRGSTIIPDRKKKTALSEDFEFKEIQKN